jgi:effector-binding domain-containing protein
MMFEAQVMQAEPETVAYITMHGSYDQIPQGYGALYGWVAQHGLQPIGAPRAVYLTPPQPAIEDPVWELWAPVAETNDVQPDAAGVGVKHVPEHMVAMTLYRGPYDAIEPAYNQLMEWVTGHGYALAGPPEEAYLSDPNDVPPEEYVTEIRFPVAAAH